MEEMNIIISTPGGPGTSLIESVKKTILTLASELEKCSDFDSLKQFKTHMASLGMSEDYLRNIFPYLQHIGFIDYEESKSFSNNGLFTNLGYAFLDVLHSYEIVTQEPDSEMRDSVLKILHGIEQVIVFQGMKKMMMSEKCKYAIDFLDVLRYVNIYGSIDSTEYFLLIHERKSGKKDYLKKMETIVQKYRFNRLNINVSSEIKKKIKKTKNKSGATNRINTFPYIKGNFVAAGIFSEAENGRLIMNNERKNEIECALEEIEQKWQTLANQQ